METQDEIGRLRELLADAVARLERIERGLASTGERLGGAEKQLAILPDGLRRLRAEVEGLAGSISLPRIKSLFNDVLRIYDIVYHIRRGPAPAAGSAGGVLSPQEKQHLRNYEVLETQILQVLDSNGLAPIPAPVGGAFDPNSHYAAQRHATSDPAGADRIVELIRPGFRSGDAVLRYAEVVVSYYAPDNARGGEKP